MARKLAPRVEFSQAKFDEICASIADGKSLSQACKGEGMPSRQTFNNWRKNSPDLQAQYDAACIEREEAIFDDIQDIADNEPDVRKAAVRIDARKWRLARMNRKKYGDRVTNELVGKDDGPVESVTRIELVALKGENS